MDWIAVWKPHDLLAVFPYLDDGGPCMINLEPSRGRIGVCRAAVQIREGMSCDAGP